MALVGGVDKVSLTAAGDLRAAAEEVGRIDGVRGVTVHDGGLDLLVDGARTRLPQLLEAVSRDGVAIRSVEVIEPDLEAVFLHLTGKALRD